MNSPLKKCLTLALQRSWYLHTSPPPPLGPLKDDAKHIRYTQVNNKQRPTLLTTIMDLNALARGDGNFQRFFCALFRVLKAPKCLISFRCTVPVYRYRATPLYCCSWKLMRIFFYFYVPQLLCCEFLLHFGVMSCKKYLWKNSAAHVVNGLWGRNEIFSLLFAGFLCRFSGSFCWWWWNWWNLWDYT